MPTRTTSAQKYAAGSPELRSVDNAGYVDPGGRTRQVGAGGAASPSGRGNGVPPPRREQPTGSATASEGAGEPPGMAPPGTISDPSDFNERAARALCDRETYCGRIGAGKPFESADACMVAKRERVRRAASDASCGEVRGDRIASCLTAIRGEPCGRPEAPLQPPSACTATVLCRP